MPLIAEFVRATRSLLGPAAPPLRDALATGAARFGLTDPRRCAKRLLTIVTFHRVLTEQQRRDYPFPGLAVTPEELCWFLDYFTNHYECGPVTQMVERWSAGTSGASPLMAVTFDDGQLDNYTNARPILERFGVLASFYVPVANIEKTTPIWHDRLGFAATRIISRSGGPEALRRGLNLSPSFSGPGLFTHIIGAAKSLSTKQRESWIHKVEHLAGDHPIPEWASMMNWGQLKELVSGGHEIGSHSMSHAILSRCDTEELGYEVARSRSVIRDRLGVEAHSFCYPNGSFDEKVIDAVRRAGYRSAVTTIFGVNRANSPVYQLRRCDMNPNHAQSRHGELSATRLALRLSGLQPGLSI